MPHRFNYLGQIPPDVLLRSFQGLGHALAPVLVSGNDAVRSLHAQAAPQLPMLPDPSVSLAALSEPVTSVSCLLNRPPSPGRLQTISTVLDNLERLKLVQNPAHQGLLPSSALTQAAKGQVGPHLPPTIEATSTSEKIQRTVYIGALSRTVSEEMLRAAFAVCGTITECRICCDMHSLLRFAFIEFAEAMAARRAVGLTGTMLGGMPIRVSPSKTAISPVSSMYLPRSQTEVDRVACTVYITNIDRGVSKELLQNFFANLCGPIERLRLLGDASHPTKIAFIEFSSRASAEHALSCSGLVLASYNKSLIWKIPAGSLPMRISPSKTVVKGGSVKK